MNNVSIVECKKFLLRPIPHRHGISLAEGIGWEIKLAWITYDLSSCGGEQSLGSDKVDQIYFVNLLY